MGDCNYTNISEEQCDDCHERHLCSAQVVPPGNVLIIEDDELLRAFIARGLEYAKHEVHEAGSIAEAVVSIADNMPDIIILDNSLPDMDGSLFLQTERPKLCPDIPVIMLTGSRSQKLSVQVFRAGVADFLTKPVDTDMLQTAVSRTLERVRLNTKLKAAEVAKETAEASSRIKSRLVAKFSHQLRTPLHHIKSYADLAHKASQEQNLDVLSDHLIKMIAAVDGFVPLVNDLVDFGALMQNDAAYARTTFAFADLLTDVLGSTDPSHLIVENHLPQTLIIRGDKQKLTRAISHLLENACAFSSPQTVVHLRFNIHDKHLQVRMECQGVQMSETQLEHMFDPLTVDDDIVTGNEMCGVGLAFCQQVIVAHGGNVQVDNTTAGATFVATLPLKPTQGGTSK